MEKRKKAGAINFINKLLIKTYLTLENTGSKKIGFFSTQVKDLVIKKSKKDIIKE